ncbi:hypothetical protein D3C72_2131080 [compost metagenome]
MDTPVVYGEGLDSESKSGCFALTTIVVASHACCNEQQINAKHEQVHYPRGAISPMDC